MIKKQKKLVKDYVGAGVTLGVGSAVLGGMGQSEITGMIVTPGANMLGIGLSAGLGMGAMGMVNDYTKPKKRKRHMMPNGSYMKDKKHMVGY